MGWKPTDLPFLVPAPQGESTPAQSTALDTLPRKPRVTVTGVDSLLNLSPPISITVQHQNPQQGDREHLRGGHFLLIITVLTPGRDQALAPPPPGLHCVTLGGAPTLAATKHGDTNETGDSPPISPVMHSWTSSASTALFPTPQTLPVYKPLTGGLRLAHGRVSQVPLKRGLQTWGPCPQACRPRGSPAA